jgi:hypothetical protein
MQNPTLVVLTDRNDLDDQLFGTFSMCKDLLRQTPIQAEGEVLTQGWHDLLSGSDRPREQKPRASLGAGAAG